MRRIIFLLTHRPDPRMIKRIKAVKRLSNDILAIFWNRLGDIYKIPDFVDFIMLEFPYEKNFYLRISCSIYLTFNVLLAILRTKAKIIYVSGAEMLIPAFIYKILFNKNVQIALEIGDIPISLYKGRFIELLKRLVNQIIKRVGLLILTSPFFWEDYYKKVYPYSDKVLVLENMPEKCIFDKFHPQKHEKFIIGFVGFIRYIKEFKILFEACKNLKDIKIVIAGGGPEYNNLKAIAQNYKNIQLLGPYDYERDILHIYSTIDLLYSVYDTRTENVKLAIPNKLYEALVCKIPILVARGTKLSYYAKKYEIVFEVADDSPLELRNLIMKLISNPSIIEQAKANMPQLKQNLYWEGQKENFIKKVEELLLFNERSKK